MLKEILLEGDEVILGIRGEYIGNIALKESEHKSK